MVERLILPPEFYKRQQQKKEPRIPLCGTRHIRGWRRQVEALRKHLQALHSAPGSPRETHDIDKISCEAIDLLPQLDPKSLHMHRLILGMLVKQSRKLG
jgi:hypothetical protein